MHISKVVSQVNWKYAAGEILLIVVGILIAVEASDWQTQKKERQDEIIFLQEIKASLQDDLVSLEDRIERFKDIESRVGYLLEKLEEKVPYDKSLDSYFGAVYGYNGFQINRAAYESLKSMGLGLITNDQLRYQLTKVYEEEFPNVETVMTLERETMLNLFRPFFLKHFQNIVFSRSATPIQYDEIVNDTEFLNFADYRLQQISQSNLLTFERCAISVRNLIDVISLELES